MDLDKAKDQYKNDFRALMDKHGAPSQIPLEDSFLLSERLRAAYIIEVFERDGEKDLPGFLRNYAVDRRVQEEILGFVPKLEPKEKRADKMAEFFNDVAGKAGEVHGITEIADLGGFSEAKARKVVADRPDLFHKVARGKWQFRDPEADRAAEAAELEGDKT